MRFFENLKYIAPDARKNCVGQMFRLLGRWILLFPLLLMYTAIQYPLLLFTMLVIAGKEGLKNATETLTPTEYWKMHGIFDWYHLHFRCRNCGKKVSYDVSFKEAENEYRKNGLLWAWFSPSERKCYNCYIDNNHRK